MEGHYFKRHFTGKTMRIVSVTASCDSDDGIDEIELENTETGKRYTLAGDNNYDVPSWILILDEVGR